MQLWPGTRIQWRDDPHSEREIVMVRRTGYTWEYTNAPGAWFRTDKESDPWFDTEGWVVVHAPGDGVPAALASHGSATPAASRQEWPA